MTTEVTTTHDPQMAKNTDLRLQIRFAKTQLDNSYMQLGKLLFQVRHGQLWQEWGFETFEKYVNEELNFSKSKAHSHIDIWDRFFIQLGIVESRLQDLGWTKAALLSKVVDSENVDQFLEEAKDRSVRDLRDYIQRAIQASQGLEDPEPSAWSSDGNEVVYGEDGSVPIADTDPQQTVIVTPEAGGGSEEDDLLVPNPDDPAEQLPRVADNQTRGSTAMDPTHSMQFALFKDQKSNVERAIDVASEIANSDKKSHLLDLICSEFLANHTDGKSNMDWWVSRIERMFKVVVLTFKDKDDMMEKIAVIQKEATSGE